MARQTASARHLTHPSYGMRYYQRELGQSPKNYLPEGAAHENHLGHELKQEINDRSVVHRVDSFHQYTEDHLYDSHDHRKLHFERVDVGELIRGDVPFGVKSDRVDAVFLDDCFAVFSPLVAGPK